MAFEFQILWTDEAISNLDDIIDYLNDKWTEREIIHFKKKLSRQISLIEQKPFLFPLSVYNPRLRKAVLGRQTTIFYEVSGQLIYIVFLFSNMQDVRRLAIPDPSGD